MKLSKEIKKTLINMAIKRCGNIFPCRKAKNLMSNKSFTVDNGFAFFWFNDKSNSTKVIKIKINK